MAQDLKLRIKYEMNSLEIENWKSGRLFFPFVGKYEKKQWKISIYKDTFDNIEIRVYGYNGILFGIFKLNNGVITSGNYYPIMRFYNQLSYEWRGYIESDTLSCRVKYEVKDGIAEITLDNIVEAVEESWNKIKDFLNKE